MKIWLLVVIVGMSLDPGQDGYVSPGHGAIWQLITDRERVRKHLRDDARLSNVVFYNLKSCAVDADNILTSRGFDQSLSVHATCVKFDIVPPR